MDLRKDLTASGARTRIARAYKRTRGEGNSGRGCTLKELKPNLKRLRMRQRPHFGKVFYIPVQKLHFLQ